MPKRIYGSLDQCRVCYKIYRNGPVGLWNHIKKEHGITSTIAIRQKMAQIPNPEYRELRV
jgi:hypothetical protein